MSSRDIHFPLHRSGSLPQSQGATALGSLATVFAIFQTAQRNGAGSLIYRTDQSGLERTVDLAEQAAEAAGDAVEVLTLLIAAHDPDFVDAAAIRRAAWAANGLAELQLQLSHIAGELRYAAGAGHCLPGVGES